ncbi:hypothetical protein HYV44_02305 [Candidatus Microgenomates bacterium]|nr:hypothetical protein [Candidatus Microgenomates bacterium]
MKLNANAFGLASGILCGAWCLAIALLYIWSGSFGAGYLAMVAALTPGVVIGSYSGAILLTVYALVSGFVVGWLFAWLYNQLAKK